MLRDLQNYVGEQTEITAQDMNTLGQAVRMLRNITGPDVFADATGIAFRRPSVPDVPDELEAQYDGQVFQAGADLVVSAGYLRLVNAPAT